MAKKRMLSQDVVLTDRFLEMSHEAKSLYTILNLLADDDGFLGNYKSALKINNSKQEHLEELVECGFIIPFYNKGVIVVRHWKINNTIQADRYTPTIHTSIKESLLFENNKVYIMPQPLDNSMMDTGCIQNNSIAESQNSIVESRLLQNSCSGESAATTPTSTAFYSKDGVELSKEELAEIKRYPNWKELLDKQANGKQGGWRGKVNKTDYEEIEYWAEKDHLQKTSSVSKPTITEDDHSKLRRHAKNIGYDDDEIDSVIFTRADIGEQTTQGILEELQDKLSGKAIDNDKPIQTYSAGKIKDLVNKTFSAYTGG